MNFHSNWRCEKMQFIRDVLVHKNVVPIHLQNRIMKELDFQIRAFANINKSSFSPRKSCNRRLKTLDQSPCNLKFERSVSISYNKDQDCFRCKKFNFQNKIIIHCDTGQHMFHEKCILDLFKEQLSDTQSHFSCFCGMKLCPEQVRQLKIRGIEHLVNQMYEQQLKCITYQLQIQNCLNQMCNFFWITNSQKQRKYGRQLKPLKKHYCPYC
ncbi:unnamed protein product (macronuclear) [Paramecium tetraurelia]|uniref:RING-type domain-containing protein n=1 Tax=Paramecium tetraurelia TaxID=5888 RepID=A0D289_PARTE|nr:uncharacterized protein GSPATT00012662001 [Paramecium tetraurelia]CAK77156.1 unnamed protein product [Paramecium tetraurelia]|eukprot:XP_001444553.1 hypothetical protein (macronuclear) [Paramecium tetraurelia strain d4-2]